MKTMKSFQQYLKLPYFLLIICMANCPSKVWATKENALEKSNSKSNHMELSSISAATEIALIKDSLNVVEGKTVFDGAAIWNFLQSNKSKICHSPIKSATEKEEEFLKAFCELSSADFGNAQKLCNFVGTFMKPDIFLGIMKNFDLNGFKTKIYDENFENILVEVVKMYNANIEKCDKNDGKNHELNKNKNTKEDENDGNSVLGKVKTMAQTLHQILIGILEQDIQQHSDSLFDGQIHCKMNINEKKAKQVKTVLSGKYAPDGILTREKRRGGPYRNKGCVGPKMVGAVCLVMGVLMLGNPQTFGNGIIMIIGGFFLLLFG